MALINTSPRASHALAALTITLETMSAQLIKDASITLPLLGTAHDADSIAADSELAGQLRQALEIFVGEIARGQRMIRKNVQRFSEKIMRKQ